MKRLMKKRPSLTLTLLMTLLVFTSLVVSLGITILLFIILVRAGVWQQQLADGSIDLEMLVTLVALSSLVIGTGLAAVFSRLPMKSVHRFLKSMEQLGGGEYTTRLKFEKPLSLLPLVQDVEGSFNNLAAELEHTENLRNDYLNNFSHEFKTPIVSIAGFAKLVRKGNLTEQQKDEYLGIIEEESMRLSRMASNALELTKIENLTILTDVTAYNLSEQLRGCLLLLEDRWSSKELELHLELGEFPVRGNKELLQQLWLNLLDNAVKFTPPGGEIAVLVEKIQDALQIRIFNTGSEIPTEALDKIFRKFYQADESHATEGNGIGLSIVKRVAELHGGTVCAESAEGRTTFVVTLPERKGDSYA